MSIASELAKAVADMLAATTATTDPMIVVRRAYVPDFNPTKDPPSIFVMPARKHIEPGTRGAGDKATHTVSFGVYKRIERSAQLADVDAATGLVEELIDAFRAGDRRLGDHVLVALRNDPIFDPELLDREGVFASVVQLDFLCGLAQPAPPAPPAPPVVVVEDPGEDAPGGVFNAGFGPAFSGT